MFVQIKNSPIRHQSTSQVRATRLLERDTSVVRASAALNANHDPASGSAYDRCSVCVCHSFASGGYLSEFSSSFERRRRS